jgi:cobaltochelatase CobT
MAYGRGHILGQPSILAIEPACDEEMSDAFGDSFIKELVDIIQDIPLLKSSQDAITMAKKVEDLLIRQKENPPPPSNGENEKEEEKEENSDEGTQEACEGDEDENEGDSEGQDEEPAQNGSTEAQQAISKPKKPSSAEIDKMLKDGTDYGDLSKMIQKEMDAISDTSDTSQIPLLPKVIKSKRNNPRLDEVQAISAASRMRAKMMGMLQDIKRQPESYGSSGKKIKSNRLEKIALGDPRIFTKKIEVKDINTAIVIAIDYSGSMGGSPAKTAISNPAAFAVHNALFNLKGTAVCSMTFGTTDRMSYETIEEIVGFGEKPTSDKFNITASGGTPLTETMWAARAALLNRKEPRKIMLILTDGYPDNERSTEEAVKRCKKDNIEVAAIGIETNCVKRLFSTSKCIKSITELPAAMFEVLDTMLIERRGYA